MLEIGPELFGLPSTTSRCFRFRPPIHNLHIKFTAHEKEDRTAAWKRRIPAIHPPNCSVNLFSSLFKSLSFLRTSSIFSTECSTVV